MGGGSASYIPIHASFALAVPSRTRPDKQSGVAGEPTEPPLRALRTNAQAHYYYCPGQLQPIARQMLVSRVVRLRSGVFPDYTERLPQEEKTEKEDSFLQRIWQIVATIPEDCATTYDDMVRLAGPPRAARQVGGVLKHLPEGNILPWHQVVSHRGAISLTGPDLQRQRQALLAEGVMVSGSGQINLRPYRQNY